MNLPYFFRKSMFKYMLCFLILLRCIPTLNAEQLFYENIALNDPPPKLYIVPGSSMSHGMFAFFLISLGAIDFFDKNPQNGLWINLEGGYYLDPELGSNWWNYYFEPIDVIPSPICVPTIYRLEQLFGFGLSTLFGMSRSRGNELIKKYIHVKPEILEEVDLFKKANFSDYVIGVHYRGTDKASEVVRVTYEAMAAAIKEVPLNKKEK